ncbi:FecR family protein [Bacteroides sp. 519]|nr:FecR family protein [Bacteroides sp. 519]
MAYLDGKLSPADTKEFEKQLALSAELKKDVDDIKHILQLSTELSMCRKVNVEKNWQKVSGRIKLHKQYTNFVKYLRNSAAILTLPLILLTGTLLYQTDANKWEAEEIETVEVLSVPGTISKINLPDGSVVWLNSGSTLTYARNFRQGARKVSLQGEAYFKVESDKENRFDVVLPGHLVVSAYGTEFNINAYPDNNRIETTLVKGVVAVGKENTTNASILKPNQQFIYSKKEDIATTKTVSLSVTTGWKDGKMVFKRANMLEIIERLSRKFNVDIILEGEELYGYEYSATFINETLPEILSLLEDSAPIKCRIVEPRQSEDSSFSKRKVIITVKTNR